MGTHPRCKDSPASGFPRLHHTGAQGVDAIVLQGRGGETACSWHGNAWVMMNAWAQRRPPKLRCRQCRATQAPHSSLPLSLALTLLPPCSPSPTPSRLPFLTIFLPPSLSLNPPSSLLSSLTPSHPLFSHCGIPLPTNLRRRRCRYPVVRYVDAHWLTVAVHARLALPRAGEEGGRAKLAVRGLRHQHHQGLASQAVLRVREERGEGRKGGGGRKGEGDGGGKEGGGGKERGKGRKGEGIT